MLVIIGLSQGNATALGVAIHEIGDGIAKIIVGVTALIPLLTAAGRALEVQPKHVARRGSAASVRVAYPARSVPHSQRCKMPLQHLHKPHQMLAIIMCKAWMFFYAAQKQHEARMHKLADVIRELNTISEAI